MVDRKLALLEQLDGPVPAVVDETPYVTIAVNGVALRIRADRLQSLIAEQLKGFEQSYTDDLNGANGAKLKAFQLAIRTAFTTILPMARSAINQLRESPKTPTYLKRMLPEMRQARRHEDRYLFLLSYIGECVHAALTQNVWQLDVASEDTSTLEVTGFSFVDPETFLAEQAAQLELDSADESDEDDEE